MGADFEQRTSVYVEDPNFSPIIKWYKSLFLQEADYVQRAEELLDKAKELLTSDLVYQDAMFVRDRLERNVSPFTPSEWG